MIDLLAMAYIVSVCLYLARQYPAFPKRYVPVNAEYLGILSQLGVTENGIKADLEKWYAEADKIQDLVRDLPDNWKFELPVTNITYHAIRDD